MMSARKLRILACVWLIAKVAEWMPKGERETMQALMSLNNAAWLLKKMNSRQATEASPCK